MVLLDVTNIIVVQLYVHIHHSYLSALNVIIVIRSSAVACLPACSQTSLQCRQKVSWSQISLLLCSGICVLLLSITGTPFILAGVIVR